MANSTNHSADDVTPNDRRVSDTTRTTSRNRDHTPAAGSASNAVHTETAPEDHSAQEALIGTDNPTVSRGNISWGAIFAGVVTFIALMMLFGIGAAALGLQNSSAAVVGIWTLVGLAIAFAAAGYLSGALGVRSGLFHGFVTWATSVLAVVLLTGWLGASVLGTLGNITGTAAQTASSAVNVTQEDAQSAAENTDPAQADQAQEEAGQLANEAGQTAEQAAPAVAAGSWWTLGGLVVGAVLASLTGAAGARSVVNKREQYVAGGDRV